VSLATRLVAQWYRPGLTPATALLVPLSALFGALAALRRGLYRAGWLRVTRLPVPVVVVGNIGVGGAGKTPLTRALAAALRLRGRRPGIVSRGYKSAADRPREVHSGDDAAAVGDEPLLHAADGHPIVIGRDRVAAARLLLATHPEVDVVLADDGLQHYALARDLEIVVVDAMRGFGNGWLMPAGPLREPVSRAAQAGARVIALPEDADARAPLPGFRMQLRTLEWRPLVFAAACPDLAALPRGSVHAIAGIAHPDRFFAAVRARGIDAVTHAFADHHAYAASDLAFPGARAILMTEKDAVKCRHIADARMWWLPLCATLDPALVALVEDTLHGSQAARAAGMPGDQGPPRL